MEERETRCNQPRKYAPDPKGREYSETIMDSKGKEMVVLRRYVSMRHKNEACWRCCCMFCVCCGRGASCWSEEMVAEVDMPAGTRVASLSYGIGADRRSPVLQVITEKDSKVYSLLFPQQKVTLAPGSGPAFQLFRQGNNAPIARIQRMIDVNSGVCPHSGIQSLIESLYCKYGNA